MAARLKCKVVVRVMAIGLVFFINISAHCQYAYRIVGTGSGSGCPSDNDKTSRIRVTFNGVTRTITNSSSFITGTVMSGTYSSPITGPITIRGELNCDCNGDPGCIDSEATASSPSITVPLPSGPNLCESVFNLPSSSNANYNISAVLVVWKAVLDTPTNISSNTQVCDGAGITLRSNDALTSYRWEVAKGTGSYILLRTTTSSQTNITAADLASRFSNLSGLFHFRIRNPNCTDQSLSNPISGIQFWAPRPSAAVQFFPPSCNGGNDGRIHINSISGVVNQYEITLKKQQPNGTYQAEGAPVERAQPISFPIRLQDLGFVISSGNYRVEIANDEDVSNLSACFFSIDQTIVDPPQFLINNSSIIQPVSCNINDVGNHGDAIIQLSTQNGAAPYSYQVNTGSGFSTINPNNPSTQTPVFSNLGPATYQFRAFYQNPSTGVTCESNIISGIVITAPNQISLSNTKTDNLCFGKNRGIINTAISGGNGGYNFSWSATGAHAPYSVPSVEDPTDLFAGDYSLTVTDVKGCSNATPLSVSITEPAQPVTVTASVPSRALYGGFDMTCTQNDGIIELTIENEAFPVNTFSWRREGIPFTPSAFTFAENLIPGNYEVTIVDANNCDASASVTLNPHPGITATTAATSLFNGFNTRCPDSPDGAGEVTTVTNAFGALSYTWFDGSTNADVFDLLPGNYAVTVIDGNGCSDDATLVITPPPSINPGIQITSNYNGASITCPGASDGIMESFPLNGLAPYTYQWDHGPSTKSITDLSQGTYSVTVTDDYGCSVTGSRLISDPATMQLDFVKTNYNGSDLTCHNATDGSVQVNVTSGAAPYTYLWSEGSESQTISGLPAGDYSVTVRDQNNCTQNNSVTIINPDPLGIDMQHVNDRNGFDISCYGLSDGAARAFLTGGTAPYTYTWLGGQSSETIVNQPAGTYSVAVRDANNCPSSGAITLTEPPPLALAANLDNPVSCFGGEDGQVTLLPSGGAGTYTHSIDNISYQASEIFSGLDFGVKDFYLRDGNGCIDQLQLEIPQPDLLTVAFTNIVDALCNDPVGSAQAVATGGNSHYQYQWFDVGTGTPHNNGEVLRNAIAGVYRVEVVDSKNCETSNLVAVSSIGGAAFDVDNIIPVTCFGFSDGSASINVASGITPFSFRWSDGQQQESATGLAAGTYFATVTDGLGCRTIKQVVIPSPQQLKTVYTKTLPNCVGDCDGQLSAGVTGGITPYIYEWVSLSGTPTVAGLCAGDYPFKVTDDNGCILEETVNLPDPQALAVVANAVPPICLGRCDGTLTAIGSGGTGPYQYQWESGPGTAAYSNLCPGDFNMTMTDAHGCTTDETLTLPEGTPLPIDLGGEVTLCVGQSQTLDAGGGWASVNWTSTTGLDSADPSITITQPGDYFLFAVDQIGCIAMDTFRLNTSLDLLDAQFLVASEAAVGDTLVAVDISWPLPDRVEWSYPSVFNVLPSERPDFLFAVVPEEGIYKLGMRSFLAECTDLNEKEIIVRAEEKNNSGGRLGYEDEFIKSFTVFPNPNKGLFDVAVLLSEPADIALHIISFPKGIAEARFNGTASDFYQVNFNLPDLAPGIYFVLLNAGGEQRLVRFFKN